MGVKSSAFFCGECGTRLFHNPTRNPNITNIKPGTLDNTSWLRPVGNLWTQSAQPWIKCSEEMLNRQDCKIHFNQIL
ncbi:GFA family protein [Microcoleus sp. A006_D1]|uniref:GFA family protein n=1 Tax=Microcoleus sp. A006_D1 TaxID=3055267 RepID=UPI003FA583A1